MPRTAVVHCTRCRQSFNATLAQMEPGEGYDFVICPHCNTRHSVTLENLHSNCPNWREGACYQKSNFSTSCELPGNLDYHFCSRN